MSVTSQDSAGGLLEAILITMETCYHPRLIEFIIGFWMSDPRTFCPRKYLEGVAGFGRGIRWASCWPFVRDTNVPAVVVSH